MSERRVGGLSRSAASAGAAAEGIELADLLSAPAGDERALLVRNTQQTNCIGAHTDNRLT